jgi:hypothetical protein
VDLAHRVRQAVKLCTGLAALLQLALQPRDDVVEREARLAGWTEGAHAAHAAETGLLLLLHAWSAGTAVRVSGSAKVETTTRKRAHGTRRIWTRCRCRIGVAKDTNHTSSHLVVDDGLVVFANNVDTEFL